MIGVQVGYLLSLIIENHELVHFGEDDAVGVPATFGGLKHKLHRNGVKFWIVLDHDSLNKNESVRIKRILLSNPLENE